MNSETKYHIAVEVANDNYITYLLDNLEPQANYIINVMASGTENGTQYSLNVTTKYDLFIYAGIPVVVLLLVLFIIVLLLVFKRLGKRQSSPFAAISQTSSLVSEDFPHKNECEKSSPCDDNSNYYYPIMSNKERKELRKLQSMQPPEQQPLRTDMEPKNEDENDNISVQHNSHYNPFMSNERKYGMRRLQSIPPPVLQPLSSIAGSTLFSQ